MSGPSTVSPFEKMMQLFDLSATCENSIERCLDEVCGADGRHPRSPFVKSNASRVLATMVDGYIGKILSKAFPSASDWPQGQKRAMTFWNNRDSLCTDEPEAVTVPKKVEKPAEFSISIEDGARAGALTAGAKLIYDALVLGGLAYPPARPAFQGLMMLLGVTPPSFNDESPRDRMMREGA